MPQKVTPSTVKRSGDCYNELLVCCSNSLKLTPPGPQRKSCGQFKLILNVNGILLILAPQSYWGKDFTNHLAQGSHTQIPCAPARSWTTKGLKPAGDCVSCVKGGLLLSSSQLLSLAWDCQRVWVFKRTWKFTDLCGSQANTPAGQMAQMLPGYTPRARQGGVLTCKPQSPEDHTATTLSPWQGGDKGPQPFTD